MLKQLNLQAKTAIKVLSKGMKSKLMLAIALAHYPDLLILDEITSGLDPVVRDDILLMLRNFIADGQKSVLFSTHITSDLDKSADEVAFLHQGHLIFHQAMEQIRHSYTLLRCSPRDFAALPPANICKAYLQEGQYHVLATNTVPLPLTITQSVPTIDDIMLLYIKGEP